MVQSELLRLQRVVVDGLFGTYNHDIRLHLNERVTLLHGPNGVGKTVVLGMINALLENRLDYFRSVPFSIFCLEFQDGSTIQLVPTDGTNDGDRKYELRLTRQGGKHSAEVSGASRADFVAEGISYLRPHGELAETWIDLRDGEVLRASDVLDRFSDEHRDEEDDTSWFDEFLKNANAHFIEAQRLIRVDWESASRFAHSRRPWRRSMISAVVECSEDFRTRIANTMVEYGRQSQRLDQSFPQRLVSATEELAVDQLQAEMSTLDRKTAELKSIGILDETPAHPFSVASLASMDRTQTRVMTLYVRDTEEKLRVLDDLATRARLLLDNVNQKYRHKRIALDRDEGFVAKSDGGQSLSLRSLSSGEQQELVLHYDLLFRVRSNTIVLIDEPELSLHVAWQKKFLPDLLKIIELSNFDALVATHSPFVIGDRDDLMVGLGDAG